MQRFVNLRSLLKVQGPLLLLILAIGSIYLLQILLGEGFYFDFMTVPSEVVSAWENLRERDVRDVAWIEFFTLFSAALLHASPEHLIGNMIFLWIFAALTVELLGSRVMLFTFFFTAITGSICHVALNPTGLNPCLGASGAVMGFEGLYLAMAVRWRLPDPHVWPIARPVSPGRLAMVGIMGLIFDLMGYTSGVTGVAYGAHLGGFIGGIILGTFVVRMPRVALPR
jgi:membrane associated rhomboid family serine protease